jgi:CheY-like chemotaxis protein
MLSDDERDELRHRALTAWHDAKRLATVARELGETSADLTAEARELTSTWHELRPNLVRQRRVVRAIDDVLAGEDPPPYPRERRGGRIGLLAMTDLGELVGVYQAAAKRRWRIVDAVDGATAIGVAMLTQPDCAVLDANLPTLSGLEVADGLRHYAPRTAVLLLTGDGDIDARARHAGFPTLGKSAPLLDIINAMEHLVA